jgi:hypothetical protein
MCANEERHHCEEKHLWDQTSLTHPPAELSSRAKSRKPAATVAASDEEGPFFRLMQELIWNLCILRGEMEKATTPFPNNEPFPTLPRFY